MDDMMAIQARTLPAEVLVIGIGNTLLGDDGVGVHVARGLAAHPDAPEGMRAFDGGTLGFRLMALFADADAVLLVDAAELGEAPGAIRVFDRPALEAHIRRGGRSGAHEAGLVDLLTLAALEGCAPRRLALIGIQPLRVDWDEALSPAVAAAVGPACDAAIRTVRDWQGGA